VRNGVDVQLGVERRRRRHRRLARRVDIVIDMKSVPLIDSCALELLMEMKKQLKKKGRDLIISDMNDVCYDILVCVKLINEFKIISTKKARA